MTNFTTPKTWSDGELVSKSMMDTHVRDNFNAVWTGTTSGDMDFYASSILKNSLPIGGYGQFLTVNSSGTAPEWGELIKNRQGGASDNFITGGTTNYDTANLQIQMGAIQGIPNIVSIGDLYYRSVNVTFPVAYIYPPMIFTSLDWAYVNKGMSKAGNIANSNFDFIFLVESASTPTLSERGVWMAIGQTS